MLLERVSQKQIIIVYMFLVKNYQVKVNFFTLTDLQGNPQRMRLHRRLYGIYTVCFLIFTHCNTKLLSFFAKIFNKPLTDFIDSIRLNLTLGWAYLKSFKLSLQFHPLWVTLYYKHGIQSEFCCAELRAMIVFAYVISWCGISLILRTRKQLNIRGIAQNRAEMRGIGRNAMKF